MRLLVYMKPYRMVVCGHSLNLLLLDALLQIIGPLITKLAIDRYLVPSPHRAIGPLDPYLSSDPWTGVTQLSLLFLISIVLAFVFNFAQSYLMQWTGQKAMFDLRRDLMAHLQRLDVAYFDQHIGWPLLTQVTTDVDVLNDLFASVWLPSSAISPCSAS